MNLRTCSGQKGLTIIEVLVVIVVLLVLAALLLPAFVKGDRKSTRTQCTAMMKQVALGYILWVNDSEKQNLPFRVDYTEGGLMNPPDKIDLRINGVPPQPASLRSNAWVQFAFMHKELADPKVLLCPADMKNNRKRKPATSWGREEEGGLLAPKYQNNAISYCINLDAGLSPGGSIDITNAQSQVLLTERHMEYDAVNSACSSGVGLTKVVKTNPSQGVMPQVGWKEQDPKIHTGGGNVALLDGSAHQTNARQVQELLGQGNDQGELHFIYP